MKAPIRVLLALAAASAAVSAAAQSEDGLEISGSVIGSAAYRELRNCAFYPDADAALSDYAAFTTAGIAVEAGERSRLSFEARCRIDAVDRSLSFEILRAYAEARIGDFVAFGLGRRIVGFGCGLIWNPVNGVDTPRNPFDRNASRPEWTPHSHPWIWARPRDSRFRSRSRRSLPLRGGHRYRRTDGGGAGLPLRRRRRARPCRRLRGSGGGSAALVRGGMGHGGPGRAGARFRGRVAENRHDSAAGCWSDSPSRMQIRTCPRSLPRPSGSGISSSTPKGCTPAPAFPWPRRSA